MQYKWSVSEEAIGYLKTARRREWEMVQACLDKIAEYPEYEADVIGYDPKGRRVMERIIQGRVISYYIDYADGEIFVVNIAKS